MLRLADYDIVFQEVPDEVTLALNLSGCPNRCVGCHSPQLMGDIGDELTFELLSTILERYGNSLTCVGFMGGDSDPEEVVRFSRFVRDSYALKTAWYSGRDEFPASLTDFNYVKLGGYEKERGGLRSRSTNQRFYRVTSQGYEDITVRFWDR